MSLGLPLEDFAAAIGVQLPQDDSLMPVAEEMFLCRLPEGWTEHLSSKGTVYFYNEALDVNQAEDPRVTEGRRRILEIKSNAAAMGLPGKERRELCEQNSHEKDIQREGGGDVQAHGGCEAAPEDADAISQEPSPPTAAASAECEAESELSIPEGSDPLSLGTIQPMSRIFRVGSHLHRIFYTSNSKP
jgi:hypothetical protein